MSRWKPAFALLLVFFAGIVVGVVGTRIVVRRVVRQMIANPQILVQRAQNQMELQLARRLNLDPNQRRQVNRILLLSQGQLREIREETQPRIALIRSNAFEEISAILTPEQRDELEKMREENRAQLQPTPLPGPLRLP